MILVHGAFHGGWCWDRCVQSLEAEGHTCVKLDLPGHGAHPQPLATVTFEQTVDAVEQAIGQAPCPVHVVAHSLGGLVAAAAASRNPTVVSRLVFLSALVPLHGESMKEIPQRSKGDPAGGLVSTEERGGLLRIDAEKAPEFLFNECPASVAEWAVSRLEPEAPANVQGRVMYPNGRFPPIPATYVTCARDRTITVDRQERIAERAGIRDLRTIEADHSPFLSRPGELAALLVRLTAC